MIYKKLNYTLNKRMERSKDITVSQDHTPVLEQFFFPQPTGQPGFVLIPVNILEIS